MSKYYFTKSIGLDMTAAEARVRDILQSEGFGILTEIDVAGTFKKKLDVDIPPYKILGACNPGLAYQAVLSESRIGTMLPCNVILREIGSDQTEVSAVDPVMSMQAIENSDLGSIADEVRNKLMKVIEKL